MLVSGCWGCGTWVSCTGLSLLITGIKDAFGLCNGRVGTSILCWLPLMGVFMEGRVRCRTVGECLAARGCAVRLGHAFAVVWIVVGWVCCVVVAGHP